MNISLTAYQTGFTFQKFGFALPYILVLWYVINKIAKFIVGKQRAAQRQAAGLEEQSHLSEKLNRKDVEYEYIKKQIESYTPEWSLSHLVNICVVPIDLDDDSDI